MVYVTSDGRVLQSRPWSLSTVTETFWQCVDFVTLFFRTLVGLGPQQGGSRSRSGNGGGSGPGGPGGPGRGVRRIGGISDIQDCSMPGGG